MFSIPWTRKPPYGTKLNRQHPLAKGLVGCFVFNESGGQKVYNLAAPENGTIDGADWSSNGIDFVSANTDEIVVPLSVTFPFSMVCGGIRSIGTNFDQMAVSIGDSAGTRYIALGFGNNPNRFAFARQFDGDSQNAFTTTSYTVGKEHQLVGVFNSDASREVYLDAKGHGINTSSQGSATKDQFKFGVTGDSTPFGYLDGSFDYGFIYDRALSETEITALNANPWQIFEPIIVFSELVAAGMLIAGISQAQIIDQLTLDQNSLLIPGNVSQAQNITGVAVDQNSALTTANVGQTQSIDNVAVTITTGLVVNDISQAQNIGAPVLSQNIALVVASLTQQQSLDNVTISHNIDLSIGDVDQAQNIDGVVVSQQIDIIVDNVAQAQEVESVLLSSGFQLTINPISQGQTMGGLALDQNSLLATDNINQAQGVQNVAFFIAVGNVCASITVKSPSSAVEVKTPSAQVENRRC